MRIPPRYVKEINTLEEKVYDGIANEKDITRLQEIWHDIHEKEKKPMTVKELKEALERYPENAKVTVFDEDYGFIDATEVFDNVTFDEDKKRTGIVVRIY